MMRRTEKIEFIALLSFVFLAFICCAQATQAATFTVISAGDNPDLIPGDGICVAISGGCTFRAAIEEANALLGHDTISFNIAGSGVKTLSPSSSYPVLTESVDIDGWTQGGPGYIGPPLIEIDGSGASGSGLSIQGGNSSIRGLIVNRFSGAGISFGVLGGNTVLGCYLGTDSTGTIDLGNGFEGIAITSENNTIGGNAPRHRNIISGNYVGILISGATATGNLIVGNYIGTDVTGSVDLGNYEIGVYIFNAPSNTIGGGTAEDRNIISGNGDGVVISGATSSGSLVAGNYVGTDFTGSSSLGNGRSGVLILNAPSTTIGGGMVGDGNVISGNRDGVLISGTTATGNLVIGNFIGTDAAGSWGIGNASNGVFVASGTGNRIGGTIAGEGNIIAFNSDGVRISGIFSTGNPILGNSIFSNDSLGIDLDGDGVTLNDVDDFDTGPNNFQNFPVIDSVFNLGGNTSIQVAFNSTPNTSFTIEFFTSSSCNSLGNGEGATFIGSTTVSTNLSGNVVFSFLPALQLPLRTFITTTATRNAAPLDTSEFSECAQVTNSVSTIVENTSDSGLGSLRQAILDANTIPGLDRIRFNIPGAGVKTIDLLSALPTITEAVIIDGETQPGFAGLPLIELNGSNAGQMVDGLVLAAEDSTIKGLIINRFIGQGIDIRPAADSTTVRRNFIGTDATGTIDLGNSLNGIRILSQNNQIGGASQTAGNLISGNDLHGIQVIGGIEFANRIRGNTIGTDITKSAALGNSNRGISLEGSNGNYIGGNSPDSRNIISANGGDGIYIYVGVSNEIQSNMIGTDGTGLMNLGNGGNGVNLFYSTNTSMIDNTIAFNSIGVAINESGITNRIVQNLIFSNDLLGIDLGSNGVSPNDLGDIDTGPNNLQNFPVLTNALNRAGITTIEGTLDSIGPLPRGNSFSIEFFSNLSCDPSGNGEGQTYIGLTVATTFLNGNGTFSFSPVNQVAPGRFITATATSEFPGDTSEFSECFEVVSFPGNLSFSETTYTVNENTPFRTITVARSESNAGAITVDYATSNGTAISGQDYTATSGTLTFNHGENVKTFDVPIINDSIDEADTETLNLTLSNPSPNVILTPNATAILSIADNDSPPLIAIDNVSLEEGNVGNPTMNFILQLSNPSSSTVTVDFSTANGTATQNSDYLPTIGQVSFSPLETSKIVPVTIFGDLVVELDETFFVNLLNPVNASIGGGQGVGTILDDDDPGKFSFSLTPYSGIEGTSVMATVSRTGGDAGTVSVDYETVAAGSAAPFLDYTPDAGTLVFADGETTKTFFLFLLDDTIVEPTENFNVVLSNPIGGASLGAPSAAAVNILDNDSGTLLSISGEILNADTTPLVGATVNLTGAQTANTTTDSLGQYSFANLAPNQTYSVAPSAIGYTFTPINLQYNNLSNNVTNADFAATGAPSRQLRIIGGNAPPTQDLTVVVELVAQGDENSLGFSVNFDQTILMNPSVVLNPDASTAFLIVNDTQNATGKLGIILALPAGQSFAAGTRSLVTITFNTAATSLYTSPVTFGDVPIVREIANINADPLPTIYLDGEVTFAQGWEADLAPRPTGSNNGSITVADFTQVGRFAAGLDTNYQLNEFQRADCSPRVSLGNGLVTVSDYTQAGRYAANLDPAVPAGGLASLSNVESWESIQKSLLSSALLPPTAIRVVNAQTSPTMQVVVSIETDAQGMENGFGFSLDYDSTRLNSPMLTIGSDVPIGSALIPNTTQSGKVGVILGLPFGVGLFPGTKQLVTIRFDVAANAPPGQTALNFSDTPVFREISDVNAGILTSSFQNGSINILGPTAANVRVGGRVLSANGQGVYKAFVVLTDGNGGIRTALTNPFGFYRFDDVSVGETYLFNVSHKSHQFAPQIVTVFEDLQELNFTALN